MRFKMLLQGGKVVVGFATLLVLLSACSSAPNRKAVYDKEVRSRQSLELPPQLSMPKGDQSLSIPRLSGDETTYSRYSSKSSDDGQAVLPRVKGARLVREGSMHWLEVNSGVADTWIQLRNFFKDTGFEIAVEDARIGMMETNWLENRADVPTNWLAKLFNKLYSTGLMDKYRIRLERGTNKLTRVFIAHRGIEEVVIEAKTSDTIETSWQPRASDPELEVEMLQRFLVYRGMDENKATAIVARKSKKQRSVLVGMDDNFSLQVNENFPRTWRRIGLALDRIGLLIEDRNRSAGLFYIQLTQEFRDKDKKGWFANLFGGDRKQLEKELLLKIDDQGKQTFVTVRNRKGALVDSAASKQILSQLQVHLR